MYFVRRGNEGGGKKRHLFADSPHKVEKEEEKRRKGGGGEDHIGNPLPRQGGEKGGTGEKGRNPHLFRKSSRIRPMERGGKDVCLSPSLFPLGEDGTEEEV